MFEMVFSLIENMKLVKLLLYFLLPLALMASGCSSNSEVVGGGIFQKRKYNKGWHVNLKFLDHSSRANLISRKQLDVAKKFDFTQLESKERSTTEFQKENLTKSPSLIRSNLDLKVKKVKTVGGKLHHLTRNMQMGKVSAKTSNKPGANGIAEEDEDDFFVYMSFGATFLGLILGFYPFVGILMGILALTFALIALGSGENTKLSSLAVIASIVLLVLASLYAFFWVGVWLGLFLV